MNTKLNRIGFHPLPSHREGVSFITNVGEVIDNGLFTEGYPDKKVNHLFKDISNGCNHEVHDIMFWKSEDLFLEWNSILYGKPIEHSKVQITTTNMERHIAIYSSGVFINIEPKRHIDLRFTEKEIIAYRYLKTAEVEHKTCNNATA